MTGCGLIFTLVAGADETGAEGALHGVADRAADDAWAVGTTSARRTVTLHRDGYRWASPPGPNPGTTADALAGVAAPAGGYTVVVGAQVSAGATSGLAAGR